MARKLTKGVKEAFAAIAAEGLQLMSWSGGGNTHYKIRVRRADGEEMTMVIAASCSDARAIANNRSLARRFVRGELEVSKHKQRA